MKTKPNKVEDLEEFIDSQYGVHGTKSREKFEEGYEALKIWSNAARIA